MSTKETSILRDFIKVLNDGIEFYGDARDELKGSQYESVFQDMIDVRQKALIRLQSLVFVRDGEIEDGHTLTGHARKTYTDIMAKIKSNKPQTYIGQLEELEDRTLESFRGVMQESLSADVRIALIDIYSSLTQCHNRMRGLKRAVA